MWFACTRCGVINASENKSKLRKEMEKAKKNVKIIKNLSSVVSIWIWSIDVSGAEAADASTPAKSIVVIDSIVVIIFCAFIVFSLRDSKVSFRFVCSALFLFCLYIVLSKLFSIYICVECVSTHDGTRTIKIFDGDKIVRQMLLTFARGRHVSAHKINEITNTIYNVPSIELLSKSQIYSSFKTVFDFLMISLCCENIKAFNSFLLLFIHTNAQMLFDVNKSYIYYKFTSRVFILVLRRRQGFNSTIYEFRFKSIHEFVCKSLIFYFVEKKNASKNNSFE